MAETSDGQLSSIDLKDAVGINLVPGSTDWGINRLCLFDDDQPSNTSAEQAYLTEVIPPMSRFSFDPRVFDILYCGMIL
jgi:hypothetical protein